MSHSDQFDYREKRTFMSRFGFVIGIVVVGAIAVTLGSQLFKSHDGTTQRKPQEMVMIKPVPPPPPPPPPQNEPKEQMMEQTPVDAQEAKPEPVADSAPAIGTNITGNGPADGFGLSGGGGR